MDSSPTPPASTPAPTPLPLPAPTQLERYERALQEIVRDHGKVCSTFELCSHTACQSSVSSWFIAHRALNPDHYHEAQDGSEAAATTHDPHHNA
jgi:hypothetical protein